MNDKVRPNTPFLVKRLDDALCNARFMGEVATPCQKGKDHKGPHVFVGYQDGNLVRITWGNGQKVNQ
jgi:hypothetical protein